MKTLGRLLSILIVAVLALGSVPANASSTGIFGKVVNDVNRPVPNTSVTISRGGVEIAKVVTSATGAYRFNVPAGTYSMRFVPPTSANSNLNAYSVTSPQPRSMTFKLTKPVPGRAFLTGTVTTSPAFALASDSTIYYGSSWAGRISANGAYRLTPTSGSAETITVKGASTGTFSFGLHGQDKVAINQDAIANLSVPVITQRVRVVTATGTPIAGARVQAGQGSYGTDLAPMGTIEGLGSFRAGWKDSGTTDANGYVTLRTVRMSPNASAGYLVTPPSSSRLLQQSFVVLTGAGEIRLAVTNQSGLISGTVRDQRGVGLGPVDIGFGSVWTTTNRSGQYSRAVTDGTTGNYSLTYRSGSFTAGGTGVSIGITPDHGSTQSVARGNRVQDFVLNLDTVRVRVVDSNGNPVARAHVNLTDNDGYALRGRYALVAGGPLSIATTTANASTDSNGFATLRTLRLHSPLSGVVTVTPPRGSPLSWKTERASVGGGESLTVTLSRPTVTVSGKVSLSDGSRVAPYNISFSDGRGGDQGTAKVDPITGLYSMQVPVGMRGSFYLTCPHDVPYSQDMSFCMNFMGGSRTVTANTNVDITIPTFKQAVRIVDPNGQAISNVEVRVNHSVGMHGCTAATANIFGDFPTIASHAYSLATTDEFGFATLTVIKMAAPCEANADVVPDSQSRYQSRSLSLTIDEETDHVVVLKIPSPEIVSGSVKTVGSTRTMSVLGNNFLGTYAVSWNGVQVTNFTVVNNTTLSFNLDSDALDYGSVNVENGGGSVTTEVGVLR
jgi:hypothetical protein